MPIKTAGLCSNILSPTYPLHKFQETFQQLAGYMAFSQNEIILDISEAMTEMLGYTRYEILGKKLRVFHYGEKSGRIFKKMWDALHRREVWTSEVPQKHKDGSCVWVRITVAASVSIDKDEIQGYIAMYQLVENWRATYELSSVLYRYRDGFNYIAATAVVNKDGIVRDSNNLFTELFGYDRKSIAGLNIRVLESGLTNNHIYTKMWEAITSGAVWNGEVISKHLDGTNIPVRLTITPAKDNALIYDNAFLVIYQDMRRENAMRRLKTNLAVELTKRDVLSGALHNIGNIMQSVVASTDRTIDSCYQLGKSIELANDNLAHIKNQADQIEFTKAALSIVQSSIKEILDSSNQQCVAINEITKILSSYRAPLAEVMTITGDLGQLLHSILQVFAMQTSHQRITVNISECPNDLTISWHEERVRQIIQNLLINSKEAICGQIEANRITHGQIKISVTALKDDLCITIIDNGGGFSSHEQTLFSQGYSTKKTGKGIGLHNAAIMAHAMGGGLRATNIECAGAPGAAFTLQLPRTAPGPSFATKDFAHDNEN